MPKTPSHDPVRDLLHTIERVSDRRHRRSGIRFEGGEVSVVADPDHGLVVTLDNFQVPHPECLTFAHVGALVKGDRVMCLLHREECFVIGKLVV